jgi:hypothetical protein|tara:strand:+ start:460 stop:582 length:123 start_codon:yes stop_codon:yes gene_type:complete
MYENINYIGIVGLLSFVSYLSYDMIKEYYYEKNKLKTKSE